MHKSEPCLDLSGASQNNYLLQLILNRGIVPEEARLHVVRS